MNIETIKKAIASALPNTPESVHQFYLNTIQEMMPKKQTFTKNFGSRGEASYTTVHQSRRISLELDSGVVTTTPFTDNGLLFMHGTDGTVAIETIRNNDVSRGTSMQDKVEQIFQQHQRDRSGEVGMRFVTHGISRYQFGNTHSFQMSGQRSMDNKVIPDPNVRSESLDKELSSKIDELFRTSYDARTEHLPLSLYLQSAFGLNDSLSQTERNAFLERSNNVFDLTSLFDARVLYELNGQYSDNDMVRESQMQFSDMVKEIMSKAYLDAANERFSPVAEKLLKASTQYTSDNPINAEFDKFAMAHYPATMINFIVSAKETPESDVNKVMAHRKLFLEALADTAGVDWFFEMQADSGNRSKAADDFLTKLNSIFDERKHGSVFIDTLMRHIDKGKVPRALIAERFGVKYISKKQFSKALQLPDEMLGNAFALAKLPDNWFEGQDMYSRDIDIRKFSPYDNIRSVTTENGEEAKSLNAMGYSKIKPFMVRAGQHLGKLDSQLQQAVQSGDTEIAEKTKLRINKEKKQVSQQYAWLSKKSDAVTAVMQFDKQYNINATLNDYERMMTIFLDALAMRAAYDMEGSDALSVDDEGKMEIQEEVISRSIFSHLEEAERDYRADLDSDHRDHGDDELFIEPIEIDGFDNLFNQCWAIKDAAEHNDRLHKSMSSISKALGEYSTNNVSWNGLIDAPADINGYRFLPITDRKRLLQEGVTQNHCVYTMLNSCLNGETSIFSIEDREGVVVATMEVQQEDEYDGLVHRNAQLYGPGNRSVNRDIQIAAQMLIEKLNEGELNPICLEEENNASEFYDTDNIEEVADLQLVPFLTDAIYDAYGIIRDHLPMGVTFSSILEKSDGMFHLFTNSQSGQAILAMDRLAEIYNLNTEQAVGLAKACPVRLINENHNGLYASVHEATYKKDQARIVNQHSMNAETLKIMATYAESYEDESYEPLWSWIEDNVEAYPEGMDEDTFRKCLRHVIDYDCAERGLQDCASTLMKESIAAEKKANRHYSLMVSYLPEHLSPEPLIDAFSEDTRQRIQRLNIGEVKREREEENSFSM